MFHVPGFIDDPLFALLFHWCSTCCSGVCTVLHSANQNRVIGKTFRCVRTVGWVVKRQGAWVSTSFCCSQCDRCLGENFRVTSMFKMDDRSVEIDPSSDVTDGESDTTGKYFNFKNASSWPSFCSNAASNNFKTTSWHTYIKRLSAQELVWLWLLSQSKYTQSLSELHTSQLMSGFVYICEHFSRRFIIVSIAQLALNVR